MLYSNLHHIENLSVHQHIIASNESVVICCGRMDPLSVHLYHIAESVREAFPNVRFCDMEIDNPEFAGVNQHILDEVPCLMCYQGGELMTLSHGAQTRDEVAVMLRNVYGQQTDM